MKTVTDLFTVSRIDLIALSLGTVGLPGRPLMLIVAKLFNCSSDILPCLGGRGPRVPYLELREKLYVQVPATPTGPGCIADCALLRCDHTAARKTPSVLLVARLGYAVDTPCAGTCTESVPSLTGGAAYQFQFSAAEVDFSQEMALCATTHKVGRTD
jgi:hypothetical protein